MTEINSVSLNIVRTIFTPALARNCIAHLTLLVLFLMTVACSGESTSGASQVRINSGFGGSNAGTGQGGSIAVTVQQPSTTD